MCVCVGGGALQPASGKDNPSYPPPAPLLGTGKGEGLLGFTCSDEATQRHSWRCSWTRYFLHPILKKIQLGRLTEKKKRFFYNDHHYICTLWRNWNRVSVCVFSTRTVMRYPKLFAALVADISHLQILPLVPSPPECPESRSWPGLSPFPKAQFWPCHLPLQIIEGLLKANRTKAQVPRHCSQASLSVPSRPYSAFPGPQGLSLLPNRTASPLVRSTFLLLVGRGPVSTSPLQLLSVLSPGPSPLGCHRCLISLKLSPTTGGHPEVTFTTSLVHTGSAVELSWTSQSNFPGLWPFICECHRGLGQHCGYNTYSLNFWQKWVFCENKNHLN